VIRVIDGRRYMMRDQRPTATLRQLYKDFCTKYKTTMSFHQWLVTRGKVYLQIR
jgi:hypothetical protein